MYVTAVNVSSIPVTTDAEGRQLGPKEWGTVETTAEPVKDAIDAGDLLVVPDVAPDAHPDAVAAFARTQQIAARAEALQAVDKQALVDHAAEHDVPGEHKPELVHALAVRLDLPIPEPTGEPDQPDEAEARLDGAQQDVEEPQQEQEPQPPSKSTRRRAGTEKE